MDSSRKACGSSSAIARKAETGVSRSAVTDFTTGTRLASRARRVNSLYSGCSMRVFRSEPMEKGSFSTASFDYRGRECGLRRAERGPGFFGSGVGGDPWGIGRRGAGVLGGGGCGSSHAVEGRRLVLFAGCFASAACVDA